MFVQRAAQQPEAVYLFLFLLYQRNYVANFDQDVVSKVNKKKTRGFYRQRGHCLTDGGAVGGRAGSRSGDKIGEDMR